MVDGGADEGRGGGEGDDDWEARALDGGEGWGEKEQEGGDDVVEDDE